MNAISVGDLQRRLDVLKRQSNQIAERPECFEKKRLYAQVELLRMDLNQLPEMLSYLSDLHHSSSTEERQAIQKAAEAESTMEPLLKIQSELDVLRHALRLRSSKRADLRMWINVIMMIVFLITQCTFYVLFAPLRLFHPTLRKLGIQNNRLPVDVMQMTVCRTFLAIFGIQVDWYGLENIPEDNTAEPVVIMFNHSSNLDPIVVGSGPLAAKWIGKRILFMVPFVGWVFRAWGHFAIDRANRKSAIESLKQAAQHVMKYRRNFAVSPEGTRSLTGRLIDFKRGPFHTALSLVRSEHRDEFQPKFSILPMHIDGAAELWPSGIPFLSHGGPITCTVLPRVRSPVSPL